MDIVELGNIFGGVIQEYVKLCKKENKNPSEKTEIKIFDDIIDKLLNKKNLSEIELKYMCSNFLKEDTIWDEYEFFQVCQTKNVLYAKWLRKNFIHSVSNNDVYFLLACENGQLEMAKWLYKEFNIKDNVGNEAFMLSCKHNNLELLLWLKEIFPSINVRFEYDLPFQVGCIFGSFDIVKWLKLENPCIPNELGVELCCAYGHFEIVKWFSTLPDYNKEFNQTFFNISCFSNNYEIAKWLLNNYNNINDSSFLINH